MRTAAARIIDANLNRAREAMRVIEDFARFAADDASTSRMLKQMRHDLAAAARVWPVRDLLAARDTPGDVGTRISTAGERKRASTADIVTAAARRLTEALRVLEEYAKLDSPAAAAAIERVRYRAYEAERRLVPRALALAEAPQRPSFAGVRLYVLITESLCRHAWLRTAREAIAGGADCLQLREKGLGDAELLARAKKLVALCRRHGVLCIINDRADIARLAGADGVHVGQTDVSVAEARRIVGPHALIGRSTRNLREFRAALRERPDYVAIGPMYETATKPQKSIAGTRILPRLMRMLARSADGPAIPLVAIGGITADRLGPILAAGCRTVSVCAAVISTEDPRAAARRLKRRLAASSARPRSVPRGPNASERPSPQAEPTQGRIARSGGKRG